MALKQRIKDETKAALLSGNRFVGEVLRNLGAAILDEEVKQNKREEGLSDEEVEKVIAREIKKRTESAKIYHDNDRPELAENEEKEIEVLQAYLPEQLSEDELRAIIEAKIAELGAQDAKMMGQVIGAVKSEVGNRADGALVASLVKTLLVK